MGQIIPIRQVIQRAERRWPRLSFHRKTSGEAAGPCPFCRQATEDGFLLFEDQGYWCRQCGRSGWIDENDPEPLTDEELREARLRAVERKAEENRQRIEALERMAQCDAHRLYHSQLNERTRAYWHGEGMTDRIIDKWMLGYCEKCPLASSASYTIPVHGRDGQLVNIRHRLVDETQGKYRPHIANLGPQLFHSRLLNEHCERLLLVEGEKKSILLSEHGWPSVGVMGQCSFQDKWYPLFEKAKLVIVGFDPDAQLRAHQLARGFKKRGQKVAIASFPVKPDDMIVRYGASKSSVESVLRQAKRLRRVI